MSLLISMLPFYIFGNLHCMGMCGPLVMMIGKHRYRYFYFFGRILSFTLAGGIAAEIGTIFNVVLNHYHLAAFTSFIFGLLIIFFSASSFFKFNYPGQKFFSRRLAKVNQSLSLLMLKDKALPTFLFGFFTLALPCGQSLIVFSACALSQDVWVGLLNGFVFALLTTPSLFMAMHAHLLFFNLKKYYNLIIGFFGLIVGLIAICRGLADLDIIPHLTFTSNIDNLYHIVIY